jgi:hypothetical protein
MAYVFGFLGLFVAIPLLATIVVTVRMLWIEDDIPPVPTLEHSILRAPVPPVPIAPEGGRTT